MILHRTVFHARLGKADNVVAIIKQGLDTLTDEQLNALQPCILTDISGTFDTVVVETTHESLATYEQYRTMMLSQMGDSEGSSEMMNLVETGRNEYYTIEL